MEENLYSSKEFDFSCLSVEKQRKLFHLASESIDVAEFLHKKGFDFDNVIKNSSFAGDLNEVKIYTNIIVYLQNKNVCDKNGTPLIAGVTNADDFMHVLRYKADIDFCQNGKSLKDYVIEKGKPEIIEVAFACGIIGITRNELMELEGINSPRRRYCPFLDMLKTEILDSEKQIKSDTCKITTKKELELSAKAEIEKLFEDAQTSVK